MTVAASSTPITTTTPQPLPPSFLARLEENAWGFILSVPQFRQRLNGIIAQLEENAATAASAADEEAARLNGIIAHLEENAATAVSIADEEEATRAVQADEDTAKIIRTHREQMEATSVCVICHDGQCNITTLCCGQPVHHNCAATWLSKSPTCMYCRAAFPPSQLGERLQQEREDRLRVELMGPDGDGNPVYLEASMMNGYTNRNPDGSLNWQVRFDDDDTTDISIPNFIRTVAGLQLRVGGVVILPSLKGATFFTYAAEEAGFDRSLDDELQMGRIGFDTPFVTVCGRIGPILYKDYVKLSDPDPNLSLKVPNFVQFLENLRDDPNNTVLLPQLDISSVLVRQSGITGIMSLLQSMGVSTE